MLIGSDDDAATRRLAELYSFTGAPVVRTDPRTAELAKYAANAFLAMRISFANELAGLAEAQDVDAAAMLDAIGLDPRIGSGTCGRDSGSAAAACRRTSMRWWLVATMSAPPCRCAGRCAT
ncbi:MAG: hypothetical protein U0531_02605 [Dehalococcoidia bacterium]